MSADDIWVFAYGSLMWRPDFPHAESRPATLHGYHRALCIYSWVYRGTPENPGLVFGLDRGGSCKGVAFRVRGRDREGVLAALQEREMPTRVYVPKWLPVRAGGERLTAYAFVADRDHEQYAKDLGEDDVVRLVRSGVGPAGPCADYVVNTLEHLAEMGIEETRLRRLVARVGD